MTSGPFGAALAALLLAGPAPLWAQLYVPNQDDATVSIIDPATRPTKPTRPPPTPTRPYEHPLDRTAVMFPDPPPTTASIAAA